MRKSTYNEIYEKVKEEIAIRKEIVRKFEKIEEFLTKAIFVLLFISFVTLCILLLY